MTPETEPRARANAILRTADAGEKARLALALETDQRAGYLVRDFAIDVVPPDRPARPSKPLLRPPREMARRKIGGAPEKRAAMLHAFAHIELNAIDLALDIIARFDAPDLPEKFCSDWITVAGEEALHFSLLSERLRELGYEYGDFPAHDGLWMAATETSHDVLARIAIVPLVLEARGLDVTPATIKSFTDFGDHTSGEILSRIYRDEIKHVATGMRWFDYFARQRGLDPLPTWQGLVRRHFKGQLKPPFNKNARDEAGMPVNFYMGS